MSQTEKQQAYQKQYRETHREALKLWRQSRKSRIITLSRKSKLAKLYGITESQYAKMFDTQQGLCAICHRPETVFDNRSGRTRPLAVDHDHATGKIRGLLCSRCNHLLGNAQDNSDRLLAAACYLEHHVK